MACCGVLAFLICNLPVFKDPVNFPDFYLSSRIVPVVCCVLVSYLITDVYFQVLRPVLVYVHGSLRAAQNAR